MAGINNDGNASLERRQYIEAFNETMVNIWKDQIHKLDVIDTGNLFSSIKLKSPLIDSEAMTAYMYWDFNEYGIYVDRGTGREVYKGNPGDIERDKVREAKPWMSKKFYRSFCNLRDFFAKQLGEDFCGAIPRILGQEDLI